MVMLFVAFIVLIAHLIYVNNTLRHDLRHLEEHIMNEFDDIKIRLDNMPIYHQTQKNLADLIRKKRKQDYS